jgi:protein-tyrosine phosphatase
MPLTVSITAVRSIQEFVIRGPKYVVLVHCQENKSRSTVFLAMYFYLSGVIPDVASALAEANLKLCIASN